MIRSTPSISGSGNITPASTTIVVSPQLSASIFMPNSPSPPKGTTSSIKSRNRQPSSTCSWWNVREVGLAADAAHSSGWDRLKIRKGQAYNNLPVVTSKTIAQLISEVQELKTRRSAVQALRYQGFQDGVVRRSRRG